MDKEEALLALKELYSRKDSLGPEGGEAWVESVSKLLNRFAPAEAAEFDHLTPYLFAGLSNQVVRPTWHRIGAVLRAAIADLEREQYSMADGGESRSRIRDSATRSVSADGPLKVEDPRSVFVVHGRNKDLRQGFFGFLRALGLKPMEWSQVVRRTGKATPYVGEILESAFAKAQAVVVLLTPDDEVRLSQFLWAPDESSLERTVQRQARPNVLFEAGMAFGTSAERTVLVQVGHPKPFSDIAGRYLVLLDNSPEKRADLAERLAQAGCPVDTSGRDWMSQGDFDVPAQSPPDWSLVSSGVAPNSNFHPTPRLETRVLRLDAGRRDLVIENVGEAVAGEIVVSADGAPISQHPCWLEGQTLPDKLRPGEEFGIKLAGYMGSPQRIDVKVIWKDEDASDYVTERAFQLI